MRMEKAAKAQTMTAAKRSSVEMMPVGVTAPAAAAAASVVWVGSGRRGVKREGGLRGPLRSCELSWQRRHTHTRKRYSVLHCRSIWWDVSSPLYT